MSTIKGNAYLFRVVELDNGHFRTQFASKYWIVRIIIGWQSHIGDLKTKEQAISRIKDRASDGAKIKIVKIVDF